MTARRRPPNYLETLLQRVQEAELKPGTVQHIEVRHDSHCAIWMGEPCDCSPEIETGARADGTHR